MKRITGHEMHGYVEKLTPFDNSKGSCYARWTDAVRLRPYETERIYICVSYGPHWPLFIWSELTGEWYGNNEKYHRPTTNRHSRLAQPRGVEITWVDAETMRQIAKCGVLGAIQEKFKQAA